MKGFLALIVAIGLSVLTTVQGGEGVSPNTRIQRYSMVVADLERALKVYRDVLGYKVVQTSVVAPDSYIRKVFRIPQSADVRSALLDGPDGSVRALYLAEVKGVKLPLEQSPAMMTVLLRIENWQQVLSGLNGLGLSTVGPSQFEAQGGLITEISFTDSDGHLIVLFQRDQLASE